MLNKAVHRLCLDEKEDHSSSLPRGVASKVNSFRPKPYPCGTQYLNPRISDADKLILIVWEKTAGIILNQSKLCLGYQITIPGYEVSTGGRSCQMQHLDRVERSLEEGVIQILPN